MDDPMIPLLNTSLANADFVEDIYEKYLAKRESVDPLWCHFFDSLEKGSAGEKAETTSFGLAILSLIEAYRTYGHLSARVNPLETKEPLDVEELKLTTYGLSEKDLNTPYPTFGVVPKEKAYLSEIVKALQTIYCSTIGFEYKGLQNDEVKKWLQKEIESHQFHNWLSIDQKKMILERLNRSELFEVFLHTKYVGQKRFSLEGGETLIPMLETVLENGAKGEVEEIVIGMAHRGRLNVLANILNKSFTDIFSEFDEGYIPDSFEGSGDVKYHKGYFSDSILVGEKKVRVTLSPNPSHLESVNPVVEGQVKARQTKLKDLNQERVIPVLIHGDAALSGQGVVYETLQMYKLSGYNTGGTIHFVINNQIGFTTLPRDARSTRYCTDIARTFDAPVFHVNAEDPEGCVYAANLALAIRQKFHCDVFVELNCYRKYGHNEADEPAYTQPCAYHNIRQKAPIREIYRDQLIAHGFLEKEMAESLEQVFKKSLQEALNLVTPAAIKPVPTKNCLQETISDPETGVTKDTLKAIAEKISSVPQTFAIHPKLATLIKDRLSMIMGAKPVDWGMAELMAYGSLLLEGHAIRLTGQDCCRGTFSHRHAMWVDQKTENEYFPLKHLSDHQGTFDVFNSPLSEFAALGFEYGYSIASMDTLVIWEAQFGDFANGSQIIIDQYIASAEQKWGQKSAITLLLPHGYEGQGPEHSSARMERFLSLCGNQNLRIAQPTTPAQLFHLIRRQRLIGLKKPLVVFTPKGLLRHPDCISPLAELEEGHFKTLLEDRVEGQPVKQVVLCSGRAYYDIKAWQKKENIQGLTIVRLEQLYPLDVQAIRAILSNYGERVQFSWMQEEPANMGAWSYIQQFEGEMLPKGSRLNYIGRPRSASPAVGSYALHKQELASIFEALKTSMTGDV